MTPEERLQRIRALFNEALEYDPSEWEDFLNKSCPDDPEMRRKVEALLSPLEESDHRDESNGTLVPQILPESRPFSLVGKRIGPYWVMRVLASGSTGVVYESMDTASDETVILRTIYGFLSQDTVFTKALQKNVQALKRLNNPNVVRIFSLSEDKEHAYVVMEYVPDETLLDYVHTNGATSWKEALPLFKQLGQTLGSIHKRGVLHRDLQPENVVAQRDEADEWQTRLINPGWDYLPRNSSSNAGQLLSGRLAPEHRKDFNLIDERTDVYGLARLAFGVLAGRFPQNLDDLDKLIETLAEHNVPPALAYVLKKAMSAKQDERYHSIGVFLQALEDVEADPKAAPPEAVYLLGTTAKKTKSAARKKAPKPEAKLKKKPAVMAEPPWAEEPTPETESPAAAVGAALAGAAALTSKPETPEKEPAEVETQKPAPEPVAGLEEELIPIPPSADVAEIEAAIAKETEAKPEDVPEPAKPKLETKRRTSSGYRADGAKAKKGADRSAIAPTKTEEEERKRRFAWWWIPLFVILLGFSWLIWKNVDLFSPERQAFEVDTSDTSTDPATANLDANDPAAGSESDTQSNTDPSDEGDFFTDNTLVDESPDIPDSDQDPLAQQNLVDAAQTPDPQPVTDPASTQTPTTDTVTDTTPPPDDPVTPPQTPPDQGNTDTQTPPPDNTTDPVTQPGNTAQDANTGNPNDATSTDPPAQTTPQDNPSTQTPANQNTTPTPPPTIELVEQTDPVLVGGPQTIQQRVRYPEIARRTGIQGQVIVEFTVNEQGSIENPEVVQGLGPLFNREALRVVRTLNYQPARQGSRPVPVRLRLPIQFQL